jgi:hypothetical protein
MGNAYYCFAAGKRAGANFGPSDDFGSSGGACGGVGNNSSAAGIATSSSPGTNVG